MWGVGLWGGVKGRAVVQVAMVPPDSAFPLSKEERRLVVVSWDLMKDKKAFAHNLFLHLFMLKPPLAVPPPYSLLPPPTLTSKDYSVCSAARTSPSSRSKTSPTGPSSTSTRPTLPTT